ncbi:bacillaene synthase trans-acting acyltransferase [Chitinophaga sp. CF118]|nr:bacillaene synthase trans-acting acyltransferase [Chitinophaga sp. CF118]
MKIVYLFSGQGSHYRGMGRQLFEHNPVFRQSLLQSDLFVQQQLGRSLVDELYNFTGTPFDDLLITHPAIVAIEIAMYCVLKEIGIQPDFVSGNSLGEFAAGVVSGIWSAGMAIEAAIEQARSIVRNDVQGGMIAVIHQHDSSLKILYQQHGLYLAADNFPGHFTLSGTAADLDRFQLLLEKQDINYLRLAVSYPFHSPLIDSGRNGFDYYTGGISLLAPEKGFISGITGNPMPVIPDNYFWEVVRAYSNFPVMVRFLESKQPCLYIDLGPSGTAATFIKYNLSKTSSSVTLPLMTPFGRELDQLEKLQELIRSFESSSNSISSC